MFVTMARMKRRTVRLVLSYSQQLPREPHSYCHRMQALSKMAPKSSGPGMVPNARKTSDCRPSENVRCSSATDLEGVKGGMGGGGTNETTCYAEVCHTSRCLEHVD